jgi:hypothetical protein
MVKTGAIILGFVECQDIRLTRGGIVASGGAQHNGRVFNWFNAVVVGVVVDCPESGIENHKIATKATSVSICFAFVLRHRVCRRIRP